jgi:hypothetical protein
MLIIADGNPRGLGYLEIDQRATGDIPVGARTPHFEADTYTCTHCQRVVVMNPERKRERYKCRGCSHHICDDCAARAAAGAPCKTWAQFLEELQEEDSRQSESKQLILP